MRIQLGEARGRAGPEGGGGAGAVVREVKRISDAQFQSVIVLKILFKNNFILHISDQLKIMVLKVILLVRFSRWCCKSDFLRDANFPLCLALSRTSGRCVAPTPSRSTSYASSPSGAVMKLAPFNYPSYNQHDNLVSFSVHRVSGAAAQGYSGVTVLACHQSWCYAVRTQKSLTLSINLLIVATRSTGNQIISCLRMMNRLSKSRLLIFFFTKKIYPIGDCRQTKDSEHDC